MGIRTKGLSGDSRSERAGTGRVRYTRKRAGGLGGSTGPGAALLLAADQGDESAQRELADLYASDPRLHPGERVYCQSPTGATSWVDLSTRELVGS